MFTIVSTHELGGELVPDTGLTRWTGWACDFAGLLLVAMALLIGVEILVRTLGGKSTMISDEYSGYLFVWITMIGFARALQMGAFLRVDNLVQLMSARGRALADVVSAAAGVLVSAVCTYSTGVLWLGSFRLGTVSIQPSATPLYLPQLILPLGMALLALLYLALGIAAAKRFSELRE